MAEQKRYYKNEEFVEKLAQRIRELRKTHSQTQEYLIDQLHLNINCYETGSKVPTLMSILKICEFYNITLGEFFAPLDYPSKNK